MIHAACALVFNCTDDEILCVSRKSDTKNLGLPAGKVEDGELPITAALRELKEETGVELTQDDFADECFIGQGNSGKEVLTALATICKKSELKTSEEGVPGWCHTDRILEGSFGAYNKALLAIFNKTHAPKPKCGCKF